VKNALKLATLLLAATALSACGQEEPAPAPPRPVLSIVARAEPATRSTIPGTVQARVETEFGFRILGRIVARNVQTGDLVKKGDVLAAIDPLALELAVRSAESDLANSRAQLANARGTEERQQALFEKQSTTNAALESAQTDLATAEAAVAKSQASLDKATEQLGYSRLLAEFDGVVTATAAEVGQVVAAGQSVVTVADPKARDVVIDVPEGMADQVRRGAVFGASLQLAPNVNAKAIVREIAPQADEATRTRRTKLTLVDPPEALRIGSIVTVTAADEGRTSIRIPASAIKKDGSSTSVWIVDEARKAVFSRPVVVDPAPASGDTVTVAEGIEPGDRVVVAGANKLEEGQTIRLDQETAN
jgi:membrane fusion protein, multidrug efflux system